MKNNLYRETFEQIKISNDCLRKVKNMKNEKRITSFRIRFAAVAAMVVVVFGCGNLVTYAATGNNLVKQISVTIHGEKKTEDITKNPDGSYEYEMGDSKLEIVPGEVEDDFDISIEQETDQDGEEKIDVKIDNANSDQKVEFQEKQQNK